MKRKYNEIMAHVNVTEEMQNRILENVRAYRPAKKRFMTGKWLSAAACLAILLTGLWLMPGLLQKNQTEEPENVSIANGIVEKDSLEQLSEAVGFSVADVTGLPFIPEKVTYWSYWDDLAQVEYEGEGQTAMFRQSEGTEDNSGDYNEHACVKELQVGEMKVTLKGETEQYTLAIWTDGGSSYSMAIESGLSEEAWAALIETIH